MKRDDTLLNGDVVEELKDDPAIDSSRIAVAVHDGVVTLRGSVPSYWQKVEAEKSVRRVMGVRALANELTVELPRDHVRDDTDIATAAAAALSSHSDLPELVDVTVHNGWITLTGNVDWNFQRTSAEYAVWNLRGVKGVLNDIKLKSRPTATDVRERIRKELARTVNQDINQITVETSDGRVTLSGTVQSWLEDQTARHAAWSAPGVTDVEDRLIIA